MDLKLPNLGEGADSGTVVNLFVKEGDKVGKDQPILELENEKAVATIPSTSAGTVAKIFVKTGDKISVGQRILALNENGGASAAVKPTAAPREKEVETEAAQEPVQEEEVEAEAEQPAPRPGQAPAAAPSIRKLARDLGIDLTKVRGSARGGRILLEDVRGYIHRLQRLAPGPRGGVASPPAAAKPTAESIDFSKWGPISKQPLSPLRQVIARRMLENWTTVPHVTQFDEADITDLNALRKKYSSAYEEKGARLTLTSFALRAVVEALKKHPPFNSSLDEQGQEIILKNYYH